MVQEIRTGDVKEPVDLSLEMVKYILDMVNQGYYSIRLIRGGEYWTGLFDFMFTTAIIVGKMGDRNSVYDRWCYHDAISAKKALNAWDGEGEPEGWHRHPFTGRRRPDGVAELETVDE